MALSHLNCKKYKETYNLYKKIIKSENDFNKNMEEYLDGIKKRIKKLVNSHVDNNRIKLLLRYYLFKIVAASKHPEYIKNHKLFWTLCVVSLNPREEIANPFRKEEEKNVQEDLEKRYDEVIASIKCFENNIKDLQKLISDFKSSLYRIFTDEDLKGICSFEKQSLTVKIKSAFLR